MKKISFTLFFLWAAICFAAQSFLPCYIEYNNDYTEIKNPSVRIKGIQTFALKQNTGETNFTPIYIMSLSDKGNIAIFDILQEGLGFKFETLDVDEDGKCELLVFFNSGANAYNLKIYEIDGDKIIPWETQVAASNQLSLINVKSGFVTVYTNNFDLENPGVTEIKYIAKNKSVKILSEKPYKETKTDLRKN